MPTLTTKEQLKGFVKNMLNDQQQQKAKQFKRRLDFCIKNGFRYYGMSAFLSIKGFLMDNEAIQLYKLSEQTPSKQPVVVEIGSWLGKSSVVLGQPLLKKEDARLFCIDPFNAVSDPRSQKRFEQDAKNLPSSIRDAFEDNISRNGVSKVIHALQGYSTDAITGWNSPIDLLFIDGNHSYEAVRRDFLDWSPFVKKGGVLAFHDTYFSKPEGVQEYHQGPGQVVQELLVHNSDWLKLAHTHSLYVVQKLS